MKKKKVKNVKNSRKKKYLIRAAAAIARWMK